MIASRFGNQCQQADSQRDLRMQAQLPRCDLAQMLYLQPQLFFNQPTDDIVEQVTTLWMKVLARVLKLRNLELM